MRVAEKMSTFAENIIDMETTYQKWENYELSPEIKTLSSFERKKLPLDYDNALTEVLEEKHE